MVEEAVNKKRLQDMFNESIRAAKRKSVEGGERGPRPKMTRRKRRRKVKVWRVRRQRLRWKTRSLRGRRWWGRRRWCLC